MEIIVEALRISWADFSLVDLDAFLQFVSSPAYDVSGADTQYISLNAGIYNKNGLIITTFE